MIVSIFLKIKDKENKYMTSQKTKYCSRRNFIYYSLNSFLAVNTLAFPKILNAQMAVELNNAGEPKHNIFSFRSQVWTMHFQNLKNGAILADIKTRCLHFWHENEKIYKIYPTSVPLTDELTRTGKTVIIQKVVGPEWRPTSAMRKRDPQLPKFMPPGKDNPLGSHALYLGWPSYRIHGTSDTRKIGRQSSSGCIGLYNEHIKELFEMVKIGTQVKIV